MLEKTYSSKKQLSVVNGSVDSVGEMGEAELVGTLVLFEANKNGEEEPIPLNSFHPNVLDWVIQKAMEIKHCIGITCEGFATEFMVLLTAIEAGIAQSKSKLSLNLVKKWERELKKLTWTIKDDGGEKSSNRERCKGRRG